MNKTGFLEIFSDVISNANANGELKGNPDKAIDLGIYASNKYFELHPNSTRTYDDLFQLGYKLLLKAEKLIDSNNSKGK
ncbi:MAG: hypothetical protein SOZ72_04235 [Treponema sp.]|nr:hypothetical protein [Treponema sp.]